VHFVDQSSRKQASRQFRATFAQDTYDFTSRQFRQCHLHVATTFSRSGDSDQTDSSRLERFTNGAGCVKRRNDASWNFVGCANQVTCHRDSQLAVHNDANWVSSRDVAYRQPWIVGSYGVDTDHDCVMRDSQFVDTRT
jgi:hypothetical protein